MQITLDVKNPADLNFLLDLLGRLQIAEVLSLKKRQTGNGAVSDLPKPADAATTERAFTPAKTAWDFDHFYGIAASKPPLSKHIGKSPELDLDAFDQYLQQCRNEWERPIF